MNEKELEVYGQLLKVQNHLELARINCRIALAKFQDATGRQEVVDGRSIAHDLNDIGLAIDSILEGEKPIVRSIAQVKNTLAGAVERIED